MRDAPESVKYWAGYDPSNPPFETESSEYDSNYPSEAEEERAPREDSAATDCGSHEETGHNQREDESKQ